MTLRIIPNSVSEGQAKNLTFSCQTFVSNNSQVTFLQINKVNPGGSLTPLVELIQGAQQPIVLDDKLIRRSRISGNLDVNQGSVYLELVIHRPVSADVGGYRCDINYVGGHHDLVSSSANNTLKA